jgi:hypothetical protein
MMGTPGLVQGRLTVVSGAPYTTLASGAGVRSTLFFTPDKGNIITLWDGTQWVGYPFSELSIAISGLLANKNYDVYASASAGAPVLRMGSAWASDTGRQNSLDGGIVTASGVKVRTRSGGLANPGELYLGTIRTIASNATQDDPQKRFVWNYYNRHRKHARGFDPVVSWVVNSTTWRQANNSASTQAEILVGVEEEPVEAQVQASIQVPVGSDAQIGISSNLTTEPDTFSSVPYTSVANYAAVNAELILAGTAQGYHKIMWLERTVTAGAANVQSNNPGGGGSQAVRSLLQVKFFG